MPKIDEVMSVGPDLLEVPAIDWIQEAVRPGFVRGGVYLFTGEPGIGKSTLGIQVGGEFAGNGVPVLYVTTEQGLGDIKRAVHRIHAAPDGLLPQAICENFYVDDSIQDIEALPRFLARRVTTQGAEYHDAKVIIIDSIQGHGISSAALGKFRALYEFAETAKARGLLTLLIGHVTKKGQIAGPKHLEHNVDCIVYLRRAFRLRPVFVPKNRFGPSLLDPLVLMMDEHGRLTKSPHATAKSTAAWGYVGAGDNLAEGQASVSLPRYGSRTELNAPFLPSKKVRQLLNVLSTLRDVDLTDLSYEINCYVPRQQRYREELDLPIAVALLGSYLQQPVPEGTLFVGELDLTRRVRAPEQRYLNALAQLITGPQRDRLKTVYIAEDVAQQLGRMRPESNGPPVMEVVDVRAVGDLEDLLGGLWPSVFGTG
jgi:DNA repair protein RadA/Sms